MKVRRKTPPASITQRPHRRPDWELEAEKVKKSGQCKGESVKALKTKIDIVVQSRGLSKLTIDLDHSTTSRQAGLVGSL